MKRVLTILFILSLASLKGFAQQDGTSCVLANPFCDSAYYFPNNSSGTTSPVGPDYGCLFSEPNPIWYYMQIGQSGTIQLGISQTNINGTGIDIDFALWGPFTSLDSGCALIMSGAVPPLQCSYSAAPTETVGLGFTGGVGTGQSTPPAAVSGQIYIIVLTNYNGSPGNISFSQTDGTGSMDCGILCGLSAVSSGPTCLGGQITLSAVTTDTITQYNYTWAGTDGFTGAGTTVTYTPTTPGVIQYTVTGISPEGDTCTANVTDTVYPVYTSTTNAEICAGETYTFYGKTLFAPGLYDTTFNTINGCDSVIKLNLSVNPLPDIRVYTPVYSICEGDSVEAMLTSPSSFAGYQWYKDGVPLPNETNNHLVIKQPGVYTAVGISGKGCTDTSMAIKITQNPAADAKILNISRWDVCYEDTVTLTALDEPGNQYRWSPESLFRDNLTNFLPTATAKVTDANHKVYLFVMNKFGCSDEDSTEISGHPCCDVYMPNVFSPNGDGLNDYYMPKLRPYQIINSFQIFDRRGNMVYDNKDPKKGWDGKYPDGVDAAQDTYMYIIRYTCTDGQIYTEKGDVTLVK